MIVTWGRELRVLALRVKGQSHSRNEGLILWLTSIVFLVKNVDNVMVFSWAFVLVGKAGGKQRETVAHHGRACVVRRAAHLVTVSPIRRGVG